MEIVGVVGLLIAFVGIYKIKYGGQTFKGLAFLIFGLAVISIGFGGDESKTEQPKKEITQEAKVQEKISAEAEDKNNHDFMEISAQNLLTEQKNNAARANKNFNGKYVKITNARVINIESDGDYISIDGGGSEELFDMSDIQCFTKYQSTREQILHLNNDQWITVYGKITHVGEVSGYDLELLKFE